jgi:uncharacterized protein (TIGR03083 family)
MTLTEVSGMAESPWPVIHAERAALADDLAGLTDAQWATPSLCGDWSVRQVLGHMTATAGLSPGGFITRFAASGFRFHEMSAKNVARETAGAPGDVLARFRAVITETKHPPGPVDAMLGEVIIHGADIRRPLGISRAYPAAAVTGVADFCMGSNLLLGGKKRSSGLTLRATDADWSAGSGPVVSGPALSLVLAITGRSAALADLSGDGLATLRARS